MLREAEVINATLQAPLDAVVRARNGRCATASKAQCVVLVRAAA